MNHREECGQSDLLLGFLKALGLQLVRIPSSYHGEEKRPRSSKATRFLILGSEVHVVMVVSRLWK
jgi:hypothetical protein